MLCVTVFLTVISVRFIPILEKPILLELHCSKIKIKLIPTNANVKTIQPDPRSVTSEWLKMGHVCCCRLEHFKSIFLTYHNAVLCNITINMSFIQKKIWTIQAEGSCGWSCFICCSQTRKHQRRAVQHFLSVAVSYWPGVWSKGRVWQINTRCLSYLLMPQTWSCRLRLQLQLYLPLHLKY